MALAQGALRGPGQAGREPRGGHALPRIGPRDRNAAGQAGFAAAGPGREVPQYRSGAPAGHLRPPRRRAADGGGRGGSLDPGPPQSGVVANRRCPHLALRPGRRRLALRAARRGYGHRVPGSLGSRSARQRAPGPGPRGSGDDCRVSRSGAAGQLPAELRRRRGHRIGYGNAGRAARPGRLADGRLDAARHRVGGCPGRRIRGGDTGHVAAGRGALRSGPSPGHTRVAAGESRQWPR